DSRSPPGSTHGCAAQILPCADFSRYPGGLPAVWLPGQGLTAATLASGRAEPGRCKNIADRCYNVAVFTRCAPLLSAVFAAVFSLLFRCFRSRRFRKNLSVSKLLDRIRQSWMRSRFKKPAAVRAAAARSKTSLPGESFV